MAKASPKIPTWSTAKMALSSLTPATYNARKIRQKNLDALSTSVREFGLVQPLVWNKRTKTLVAGHQRVHALASQGVTHADVVVVDLPVAKEKALNVALNSPLLAGEFTDGLGPLLATDPPYGVDYAAVKNGIPRSGFRTQQEDWGDIAGDELKDAALQDMLERVFRAAVAHALLPNAAWYLWHAHLTQGFFAAAAAAAANVMLHRQIIWKKPHMVLTRSGQYHWQHEPCFYGWVKGNPPPWYGTKSQTSVWEVGREDGTRVHQTQKPVELFAIPIRNHTKKGDLCFEPFSGSGTQLVAAQQLERRCRAIEIEGRFCDVAIERLEALVGAKARLVGGRPNSAGSRNSGTAQADVSKATRKR